MNGKQFRNFIARFGPREGPLIVIGAHYDSCGDTPGADDNASGVAGLLELARLLARKAADAAGGTGRVHTRGAALSSAPTPWAASGMRASSGAQNREVRLMLSLEMIGYYRDAPNSQALSRGRRSGCYIRTREISSPSSAPLGDFGATRRVKGLFQGASDLPVVSINAPPALQGMDFSDHASYWRFGMPAIMVTDTAFLRNPNYHEAGDTPDTLDYARMAKVVRAVHAVAMEF